MPKDDEALQKELGVPKGYKITPITEDYPRIIPEVVKARGIDKTISPVSPSNFRGEYDESHGEEENLHTQYVKANDIEVSPKSFKQ